MRTGLADQLSLLRRCLKQQLWPTVMIESCVMMNSEKQNMLLMAGQPVFCRQPFSLRYALLGIFISLFLVACDNDVELKSSVPDFILVLNDDNMHEFTVRFAHDYLNTLENLVNASTHYRLADDGDGLTTYRNQQWTPLYIEKKYYYQAVLQKNKPNIYRASIDPLFDKFDRLINISVNLKHAVLDRDDDRWQQTLAMIKRDKQVVTALIKSSGESKRFDATASKLHQ